MAWILSPLICIKVFQTPTQRISDNYIERICAFLYALIQTLASGSIARSRNCLIIIDLTRQQDKTATKHNEKSNITFDNAFSYGIVVFAGKRKLFCDKVWLLRGSILQQQLLFVLIALPQVVIGTLTAIGHGALQLLTILRAMFVK